MGSRSPHAGAPHVVVEEWRTTARQLRNGTPAMARTKSNPAHLVAQAKRQALRRAEAKRSIRYPRPGEDVIPAIPRPATQRGTAWRSCADLEQQARSRTAMRSGWIDEDVFDVLTTADKHMVRELWAVTYMKRYEDDGHTMEHESIADQVWNVLDKYEIEEDERGFPTQAACRDSECDSGGTSTKEGTADPDDDSGGTAIDRDGMTVMMAHTDAKIDKHTNMWPVMTQQTQAIRVKTQRKKPKAQESKHARGVETLEHKTPNPTGELGVDIGGRQRKPKPRGTGTVDEFVWAGAMVTAREQLEAEFKINKTLEEYYKTMCKVGQKLLADELHRRCQGLYDYRVGKQIYRENRRKTE